MVNGEWRMQCTTDSGEWATSHHLVIEAMPLLLRQEESLDGRPLLLLRAYSSQVPALRHDSPRN